MHNKAIPRYRVIRIYFFSILIYFLLIMPVLMVLSLKMAPKLIETRDSIIQRFSKLTDSQKQDNIARLIELESMLDGLDLKPAQIDNNEIVQLKKERDSLAGLIRGYESSMFAISVERSGSPFRTTFSIIFWVVILFTIVAGLIVNAPLKRYFRRRRKRKPITEKLRSFCKRILLFTPHINAGILFFSYLILHTYMFYVLMTDMGFDDAISHELFLQFFYVSFIASLPVVLFVFFWQKHRVHIVYLEHVFDEKELYTRPKQLRKGSISKRLWISSAMTTLFPLAMVMLYIVLAITPIRKIDGLDAEQMQVLLGPYFKLIDNRLLINEENLGGLFYVNAVDNILMFTGIVMVIMLVFIYITFFVRWTAAGILSPVKELLYNMRWTGQGLVNNFTVVRTNDEIGELSEAYNNMNNRLNEYIENISGMNEAYVRFLPQQFLQFFGKEKFTEIKVGDQVQKEMAILFSDIKSFTELSEEMTPGETFDFINHYLSMMEPAIRKNKGFIDKYMGDSIMAFFGESVDDAIKSAVEMRMQIVKFNNERMALGKEEINIGIGIHIGDLILGIVGNQGRMQGTVISDAVNLASRLKSLTKVYGASIIISEDALIKLKNHTHYQYRILDIARVKGKRNAVYIFEILNGEEEKIKKLKWATRNDFAEAVELYQSQKFNKAAETFQQILKKNPGDLVAQLYISRCKEIHEKGLPKDPTGIDTHELS